MATYLLWGLSLLSLGAGFSICFYAEMIGRGLGVMDHPDSGRKLHDKATPLVGGIAILVPLAIWIAGALIAEAVPQTAILLMVLICTSAVGILGFADDQHSVSPLSRILLLLVVLGAAFAMVPGLIASKLNWGSFEPTSILPWGYCALIGLTTVGIVNAVNMADGQNGLVSSMFVIWAVCIAFVGDGLIAQLAQLIAVSCLIVLAFNLRGRLFLGDCGSYGVTFALGLLLMLAYAQGRLTIETVTVWFFIPVADCLRLMLTRRLNGRSAMTPDRDHFHHRLQAKLGKTEGLLAYIASVATTSLIATLAPHFALVCLIVLTAIYFSFAWLTDPTEMGESAGDPLSILGREGDFANVVSIASAEKKQSLG